MITPEILAALDRAYRLDDLDDEAWLRNVADALRPALDIGHGIHAFLIDTREPDAVRLSTPVAVGLAADWNERWPADWWEPFMLRASSRSLHTMLTHSPCNHSVQLWDAVTRKVPSFRPHLESHAAPSTPSTEQRRVMRYPDSLNVIAADATGLGCAFAANRPHPASGPTPRAALKTLSQLATHIAAAYRLRRQRADADALAASEAIIDQHQRVVHATGEARSNWALGAIREAAVAVARARPQEGERSRLGPEVAIEAWQSLTAGRWSVLDHFDRDGRRYFIARPNAPETSPDSALSERERQVLGALALGHSNKLIAYELGLHPSTVSNHLASAGRKLGVGSRIEMVRCAREIVRGGPEKG